MVTRFRQWEREQRAAQQPQSQSQYQAKTTSRDALSPHKPFVVTPSTSPSGGWVQMTPLTGGATHSITPHHSPHHSPHYSPLRTPHTPHSAHSLHTHSEHTAARPRQLIVAVTANGGEIGGCGEDGFDEICPKPLTKSEIYRIISRYFQ